MCFPSKYKSFFKSIKIGPKRANDNFLFPCFLILVLFSSCAQIRTPTGGERDKQPPILINANPAEKSVNFSDNKIVLEFDEFIQLKNRNRITITPEIVGGYEIKDRLKIVEINLKGKLQENTTYVINFGNSVADLNEGNELKNFNYVFSTGNTIDSLSIQGKITDSKDGKEASDIMVLLFKDLDTIANIQSRTTPFIVQTTTDGFYKFNNLSEGVYKIVAVRDENLNRRWDIGEDIGYSEKIQLLKDSTIIDVKIYETEKPFKISSRRISENGKILINASKELNKNLEVYTNSITDIVSANAGSQTAIWFTNYENSGNTTVTIINGAERDSTRIFIPENLKPEEIKITNNLTNNILRANTKLKLIVNNPVKTVPNSIILLEDTLQLNVPILSRLTILGTELDLDYLPKPGKKYRVMLSKGMITDIYKQKNQEIILDFGADDEKNYGNLVLNYNPQNKGNYIIELKTERGVIIATEFISNPIQKEYKLLSPGKYFVTVYYDTNNNGIWDKIKPLENKRAENIYNHPGEIILRSNWDVVETIIIP